MIISKKKKIQPESSKSLLPPKSTSASSFFNFKINYTKGKDDLELRDIRTQIVLPLSMSICCATHIYVPYLFRILTCFLGGGLNIANIHSQDYRFSRNGRNFFLLISIFFPRSCSWQLPKTENEVKLIIFCHFRHHRHLNHHLLYQQHHHQ